MVLATTDSLAPKTGELPPEMGRPPPGGEEAEVVVYQPRGVGLMHTRHKPSNAHYTHDDGPGCKSHKVTTWSTHTAELQSPTGGLNCHFEHYPGQCHDRPILGV